MTNIIRKSYCFILAIVLISPVLYAQQDTMTVAVKDLSVTAGYLNLGSVDELYSYSRYSGNSVFPRVRLEGIDEGAKEVTDIKLTVMNRYPSVDLPEDIMYYNRLEYLQTFLYEQNETFNYPEPRISNEKHKFYYAINWYTYVNITLNSASMPELLLSSLGPGMTYAFKHGRHHLYASASAALVSYTCRNSYGAGLAQDYERFSFLKFIVGNSRIQTVLNLQTVLANINYQFDLNEKTYLEFNYDFRFIHDSKPRNLTSASGMYSMGVGFRLK